MAHIPMHADGAWQDVPLYDRNRAGPGGTIVTGPGR